MINTDRNALICDLAETYGIYDYRSLPTRTVATLSVGLRNDSRIKTKLRGGRSEDDKSILLAMLIDRVTDVLSFLGAYKQHPESITNRLLGLDERKEDGGVKSYASAEEFERARRAIING